MARKMSPTACFEAYGTKPMNIRWSWSARNEATKTVAVRVWQDRFEDKGRLYRSHTHSHDERWLKSPGHAELLRNLAWARDNCDGEVSIIIVIPKDRDASPREIAESFVRRDLRMRVTELDETTGEFVLERVDTR